MKRMGVVGGFPDLVFFGPHGEVCFIELKASRGSWLLDDPETRARWDADTNESPCYCTKLAWRCASRKKGRLNDKRPKSREETPKEGSGSKIATACVSYSATPSSRLVIGRQLVGFLS